MDPCLSIDSWLLIFKTKSYSVKRMIYNLLLKVLSIVFYKNELLIQDKNLDFLFFPQ